MNSIPKPQKWLMLGLLLALLTVVAQTVANPKPPLSAVGRDAPWTAFEDDYRLTVTPEWNNRPVQLELFSPEINLNDYLNQRNKSPDFYGDEIYGKDNRDRVSTTFTLSNLDGTNLAQKTYRTSSSHRYDAFYLGILPQGSYPLQALTDGRGKNGFGFRVSKGAVMEASQYSEVQRGNFNQDQLLARFNIPKSAVGQVLKLDNYDADGPKEAKLYVEQPGNRRSAMAISGNTEWAGNSYTLTAKDVGEWVVGVRILPTTKQFSNSIGLRFRLNGKPFYVKVPQVPGRAPEAVVNVNPVAQVCSTEVPLKGVGFTYGDKTAKAPSILYLLPGSYTLQGEGLGGIQSAALNLELADQQTVAAKLVYAVTPKVSIEPGALKLEVGQTATATVKISTDFPQAIPYKLSLSAPNGVTIMGNTSAQGTVSAGKPAQIPVQIRADAAAQGDLKATLEPNCAEARASVTAVEPPAPPQPANLELTKSVTPAEAQPGDTVKYTVTITNTGGSTATGVHLTDPLPEGLQGTALDQTFDLEAGASKTFEYSATVTPDADERVLNTAAATTEDGIGVIAVAELKVNQPKLVPEPEPANLELTKSVTPAESQPGDTVKYTVTVTNTGGSTATGVHLSDPLADGLQGAALNQTFDLAAGESKTFEYAATVSSSAEERILNTASVTTEDGLGAVAVAELKVNKPQPEPANLDLTKTVKPTEAQPGEAVEYTVTVTNTGGSNATDVHLSDPLATGLDGIALDETFDLAAGESKTFKYPATVNSEADERVLNTASVTTEDGLGAIAVAELKVNKLQPEPEPPLLEISKSVEPSNAKPGDTVQYTVTLKNIGGSVAKRVHLTDPTPDGLQSQGLDQTFDLAAGESKKFGYNATVLPNADERVLNTATAVTEDGLGVIAVAELRVAKPLPAKLVLTRTALSPNPAFPGEQTKVCLQVKNVGGTAANYTLTDDFSALLEPTSDPFFEGTLNPGQTIEHCYTAKTTPGANDTAELTATLVSEGLPDQTASTPYERVNLSIAKSTSTPVIRPGREARFQITVTNPLQRPVTVQLRGDSSLQLTPDETRTVTLNPGANSFEVTGTPQEAGDYPNTITPYINDTQAGDPAQATVTAKALPDAERETEVTVAARLAETPAAGTVIISDVLPEGAEYEIGSSKLLRSSTKASSLEPTVINRPNRDAGQAIGDPLISGNRLYWVVPGPLSDTYVVSYLLRHTEAIQLPTDKLGVILQVPQSKSAGKPRTPGGQPVLGSLGDLRLLSGESGVLEDFLDAQPITSNSSVSLRFVQGGGKAVQLSVYPTRPITTDKADQPELTVLARDAQGQPANIPYVTVEVSPEAATPDAAPEIPGYQVKIVNGQGSLRLSNLGQTGVGLFTPGSPDKVTVRVSSEGVVYQTELPVEATERPMIVVGAAGVQVSLVNFKTFSIESSVNAFARGELGNGALFTGAVNTGANWSTANGFLFRDSDLLPPANPYERFPLTGDGQTQGADAISSDCCFFRLELGRNYLQYGQMNAGFTGLLTGYSAGYNGLKGVLRNDGLDVNGFVALMPNSNLGPFRIAADGSSVYRLANQDIVPSSDQVAIVVRKRDNGRLQTRINLARNVDYRIDYIAGVIELLAPLARFDQNGDTQELEVRYATTATQLETRAGVQATLGNENFGIKATFLRFDAAQPSLLGLGAHFKAGALGGDLELASNTSQLGLIGGAANLGLDTDSLDFRLRYQDLPPGYIDPREGGVTSNPGKDLQAGLTWQPSSGFSLSGRYNISQSYTDPLRRANNQFSLEGRLGSQGSLALLLGGGAGFDLTPSITNNFSTNAAYLSAGLELPLGNLTATIRQLIGLGATPGATDVGLDYALSRNFGIRFQSRISYTANGYYNVGALGVRGSFANSELLRNLLGNSSETPDTDVSDLGNTNIAAAYELPDLSGEAGRSRVGLDTTIPLSTNFSINLGTNITVADKGQGGASANFGLRYAGGDTVRASANAEVSGQAIQPGLKTVFSVRGAFRLSDTLIVSPSGEYVREATGTDGARFSLAAAVRSDQWSILTNNIFRSGFYRADNIALEGEVRAGYQANERFYLRLGGAYRIVQEGGSIFVGQIGGGLTYFLNDVWGVGVNGSYLFDTTGYGQGSFGLEGSFRINAGWLLSAGINLLGTNITGIGGFQSQPGLYLRLDWKFDENTFGINW